MQALFLDLRYRAEYLGLRLIAGLVRAVPLDVGGNVSARIWRLIAPYDRRHRRALQNLDNRLSREDCRGARGIGAGDVGEPRARDG